MRFIEEMPHNHHHHHHNHDDHSHEEGEGCNHTCSSAERSFMGNYARTCMFITKEDRAKEPGLELFMKLTAPPYTKEQVDQNMLKLACVSAFEPELLNKCIFEEASQDSIVGVNEIIQAREVGTVTMVTKEQYEDLENQKKRKQ